MISSRRIEPEWLDELSPDDPRAMRSRRDLRRVNALMMNAAVVGREFRRSCRANSPCIIAEIGAGDGTFMLKLAKKTALPRQEARIVLLDRLDTVSRKTLAEFAALGWQAESVTADAFEWLARPADRVYDLIVANLFLHHFDPARLKVLLFLAAQRTRRFVACEPRRSGLALAGSRLLGLVGCNDVSRHDAVVSVRAGFDGLELSALWPASRAWVLKESAVGFFSHSFVASRLATSDGAGRDDGR